jgi:hypothetical protein
VCRDEDFFNIVSNRRLLLSQASLPMPHKVRVRVSSNGGGEQQSVATPQAARGWALPPYRHFKIQSCCRPGFAFEVAAFFSGYPHTGTLTLTFVDVPSGTYLYASS